MVQSVVQGDGRDFGPVFCDTTTSLYILDYNSIQLFLSLSLVVESYFGNEEYGTVGMLLLSN